MLVGALKIGAEGCKCQRWEDGNMVYTIGYAGLDIDRFLDILKENKIYLLIDVRSLPKSKYFKDFNDNNLSKLLPKIGIKYENWKKEFGARQDNFEFYTNGILDYEKFAKSEQFQKGIEKVKEFQNENICLMCSEIDPLNCHRGVLCGRKIFENGMEVFHIIAKRNGETNIEDHTDFEKRLMLNLKTDNVQDAYIMQNKRIGYKLS